MARLAFASNQSLDCYVDHVAFAPESAIFHHFINGVRGLTGSAHGRRMYETMRYWDEDHPEWNEAEREYAAWRAQPKWVVSRSMTSGGPNGALVTGGVEATIRELKSRLDGVIEVSGLAGLRGGAQRRAWRGRRGFCRSSSS